MDGRFCLFDPTDGQWLPLDGASRANCQLIIGSIHMDVPLIQQGLCTMPLGHTTMPDVLPPETIKHAIEVAFRPLRCVAEIYDDGTQLRFRLFDPSDKPILGTLLKMEGQRVSHLSDPQNLNDLITLCREHAEELGYRLDPRKP